MCKDPILSSDQGPTSTRVKVLAEIQHLLVLNKLPTDKIPSLKLVKRQQRVISLEIHPDKNPDASDEEKIAKLEETQLFLAANNELRDLLIEKEIIIAEEENIEFDELDELTEEEIERITKKGWKVRDHCHWTGRYRGAAHSGCNLALRKLRRIPVVFHNLAGYDGHIIIQAVAKVEKCKEPRVIAKSMEKFLGFTIGNLQFTDSLQHLSASLDKLVTNLAAKTEIVGCSHCPRRGSVKDIERHKKYAHKKEFNGEHEHNEQTQTLEEVFPILHKNFKSEWKNLPDQKNAFKMLTRKGVYPYSYMDSFEKFEEGKLPKKEDFYNELSKKHISDDDWDFVNDLWQTFDLKTLGQLHDLYLSTDTLLLVDVFENYRRVIHKNYGLDPIHFYTAPSLSWSAGLKYTGVRLELPTDININIFIDEGLRGGISLVGNHFAKANNKLLPPEFFDKNTKQSFIKFVDANNLYGWAMSQCLPTGGFKWVKWIHGLPTDDPALTLEGTNTFKSMSQWEDEIIRLDDEAAKGYIFKIDLEYPQHLRLNEMHDNFPLAPESFKIEKELLSPYQKALGEEIGVKYGSEKLCLTLNDKTDYICHYRNLKFYLKHGMKLKKIHRILQFDQSPWLEPYIKFNTKLRSEANNKFEEEFAKLMNNSFFGKL